jgi:hypothetical protein
MCHFNMNGESYTQIRILCFPSHRQLLDTKRKIIADESWKADRVTDAIAIKTDPWQRMETACVAHVTGLLDWRRANQVLFVMPPWHYPESIKARVISLRDEYERIFADLIEDLPLRPKIDKRYLRLTLIGALSWSLFWYKRIAISRHPSQSKFLLCSEPALIR